MSKTQSAVKKVIDFEGLKPGDTMKTVHGNEIENSVVLGTHACAIISENRVEIFKENPIFGTEEKMTITLAELKLLADAFLI